MTFPSTFRYLLVALCLSATAAFAQQPPAETDEAPSNPSANIMPSGSARLMFEGKQMASVGFSLRSEGPRFALSPIAQVLGTALRVGPLGDAHTLVFDDKQIVLGPDDPTVVTVSPDGTLREEIWRLEMSPLKTGYGLEVPLQFLRRSFGDEFGYEFDWNFRNLELSLTRRELRELTGTIELVHQHRASTLEIAFSERPRFRFEELPGAVEIRLVGDSFSLTEPFSRPADPLVSDVITSPTRIRMVLAEEAKAFEPRLVPRGDGVSMVIDIFRQRTKPKDPKAAAPTFVPLSGGIRTIVLDPGHGGPEQTGAIGPSGTLESDLTLMMARLLRTKLEQRMPVRVVLTREKDEDIAHAARTAMANENKADLFISLHFNSYRGTRARGAETYFLSREASDELAAQLAAAENSSSGEEQANDDSGLELILWDLAQSYHLNESQRFANLVQEELNQALGIRDRGVRQAPFKVLMGATMPAVLVELGFISSPAEETKLRSPVYRAQLAEALVRAVVRFKIQLEARSADPRSTVTGPANGVDP